MRIAVSVAVAVLALGSASQAMAAEPSAPFADSTPSMHAAVANAPVLEARFDNGKSRFQDRPIVVSTQFATEVTALRHRFASQMMEFYPVADSGFHLSGGVRFFNVTNFAREADKLTNNLLWSPASRGFSGTRTGFNRKTPAMTMGYTQTVANKLALGVEAGTLLGRVNANMPHALGRTLGETGAGMRMNPVAAFVMGLKF